MVTLYFLLINATVAVLKLKNMILQFTIQQTIIVKSIVHFFNQCQVSST